MKLKPRLYAQALVSVLQETESKSQQQVVLRSFAELLAQNKQQRDWPRIARLVERYHQQATSQAVVQIAVATEPTAKQLQQVTDFLREQLQVEHLQQQVTVDPQLLAGLTIQARDHFYDLSLKNQLQQYLHKVSQ